MKINLLILIVILFLSKTIDDCLYNEMLEKLFLNDFDFCNGSIGCCLYFIKRFKNTKSLILKYKYKNYIIEFLFFLERMIIKNSFKRSKQSIDKDLYISRIIDILLLIYATNDFNPLVKNQLNIITKKLNSNIQADLYELETLLRLLKISIITSNKLIESRVINSIEKRINKNQYFTIYEYLMINFYCKYHLENLIIKNNEKKYKSA